MRTSLVITVVVIFLCSCSPLIPPSPTFSSSPSPATVGFTVTPPPTEAPLVAGQREVVTPEDVKNITPSLLIGSGEEKVTIYPPNSTDIMKGEIEARYSALIRKWGIVKVYFNQDTTENIGSGNWVLYPVNENGDLIHQISKYGEGSTPEQPSDYPVLYKVNVNGGLDVNGEYAMFDIPGAQTGVVWTGQNKDHRLPQFVAGKVTLADGTTYEQQALNYKSLVADGNVWEEVGGVAEIVATDGETQIGKDGNPVRLGDLVENSDQEGARQITEYFNGTEWVKPSEGHEMVYYPNFDGVLGPAIGTKEWEVFDDTVHATKQLEIVDNNGNTIGKGDTILAIFSLRNCVIAGHKMEEIILDPGTPKQVSKVRDFVSLAYLYSGKNYTLNIEARDEVVAVTKFIPITLGFLQDTYLVGTRLSWVDFIYRPSINTAIGVSSKLQVSNRFGKFCNGSFGDIPLSIEEIKLMLTGSQVSTVEFSHDEIRVNSLKP